MRQFVFLILILLPISVAFSQAWQGVDVSFLSEMEGDGVVYQDEFGADIDEPRAWMAEKGVNLVRLRVWHNPYPNLRNSWLGVAQEAAKWDSLGVSILLDYHFSDTWADPGHQQMPAAWENMSFEELQDAMSCWLHCTLEALDVQGIEPAMVQLGNEIDQGMMWPHGGIDSGFGPLAELLASGHEVVEQVFPNCQVAVHVSSLETAPWFFEELSGAGYTPDVVAVSQYSKWHLQDIERDFGCGGLLESNHRSPGVHCRNGLCMDHRMVGLDRQPLVDRRRDSGLSIFAGGTVGIPGSVAHRIGRLGASGLLGLVLLGPRLGGLARRDQCGGEPVGKRGVV